MERDRGFGRFAAFTPGFPRQRSFGASSRPEDPLVDLRRGWREWRTKHISGCGYESESGG